MDSSVLLHHVRAEAPERSIYALSFNYGQRHVRELECAVWQARAAGAIHQVVDISFLNDLLKDATTLVADGAAVPDLSDVPEGARQQPPTYVPNRNMTFLSMAAAFGEAHGAFDVFYAAQAQDEYGYWDCTEDFVHRLNGVLELNRNRAVTIHGPFLSWSKSSIVRRGGELGVDFSNTWSCYRGAARPCLTCPTCVERATAFREAGVADPLSR